MNDRYEVEPEYQIEPSCRCCSCWERTGKWLVCDKQDEIEDLVFDTEEQAKEKAKQLNEDHIQLAKRAVACKNWKWIPGMRALVEGLSPLRVLSEDTVVVEKTGAWYHLVTLSNLKIPDFSDLTTACCMLGLVREVRRDQTICTDFDQSVWSVITSDGITIGYGQTEIESLIDALEASNG